MIGLRLSSVNLEWWHLQIHVDSHVLQLDLRCRRLVKMRRMPNEMPAMIASTGNPGRPIPQYGLSDWLGKLEFTCWVMVG